MNVVWLRRATRSLEYIADFIARENPRAAFETSMRLTEAAEALGNSPEMGRPGRVKGTRELVFPGTFYVIPYRVNKGRVEILHVLHSSRRWPDDF